MMMNPSAKAAGLGPTLPVHDASWYDAAVYSNARSKRDGLDTVYTYTGLKQDYLGSIWQLEGFGVDLSRNGWRLPTEAEWEYAARAGGTDIWAWGGVADSAQAAQYSWYQANSGGVVHPVGTLKPNAWGLHDMTGNVMEWTNDWKGDFPEKGADYAGLHEPGGDGSKPLKGGAYCYGLAHLRPASRSATYAALPGSIAGYVGFRCARGAIERPSYRLPGGGLQGALPTVTWDLAAVRKAFGYRSSKVAFVQAHKARRILSWIDFSEGSPAVHQIEGSDGAYHPSISPDGQWVAWSTVQEGSRGDGRIRVRRLSMLDTVTREWSGTGAIPRWWVRKGTRDTFLVVPSSAMDDNQSGWSAQTTRLVRYAAGRFGADSTLTSAGSYHDGISANGRWLATGYTRLRRLDLATGSSHVSFTGPQNGKQAGDTSQVCNVSSAPDSSGDVLALDFGYTGNSTVVGGSYGIHEVAFRIASDGRIRSAIRVPEKGSSFEDLEWSNDPEFAGCATLDSAGRRHLLWILGLRDSSAQAIVRGSDLWQPSLWVEPADPWLEATRDSIGAYNTPSVHIAQEELATKMVRFWTVRDSIELAALGSSRTMFGFAPSSFTGTRAFNFAASGGPLDLSDSLIENYLLPHAPRLRTIVLEFDAGWILYRKCDDLCEYFEGSLGRKFDKSHGYWQDSLPARVLSRFQERSWNKSSRYDAWGGYNMFANGWGEDISNGWANPLTVIPDTNSAGFRRNVALIGRLADTLAGRGIKLLMVGYPMSPKYRNATWPGRHEPPWALYRQVLDIVARLQESHANFRFYDAHMDGLHDYTDEDAYDGDHLSTTGAIKLSGRIDSLLKAW